MKILLINNNPVVSRLTALSARKENIEIDEIQEVTELEKDNYDIVFVDADSLSKDVKDVIGEHVKSKKSVLFYAEGDNEEKSSFDLAILKPFLPSEVSAVIRSIESIGESNVEENEEESLDLFADKKEDSTSSDELFSLNALDESSFDLDLDEKKSDTLNLLDSTKTEESFDSKLEEAFPLNLDDDLFEVASEKKDEIKEEAKETLLSTDLTTDLSEETDLFENTLDLEEDFKKETKKEEVKEESKKEESKAQELFVLAKGDEKKVETELDDELFTKDENSTSELLDFEDDKNESDLLTLDEDVESKKESSDALLVVDEDASKESSSSTKILDEDEVENIKGLLSEDTDNDLSLDDLMTPAALVGVTASSELMDEKKEKKKKSKKTKENNSDDDSNVLIETLTSLPVENLRELLAGARVNINIKFPKSK